MENESLNKVEELLLQLNANIGEIETFSRMLDISFHSNENLQAGDMENTYKKLPLLDNTRTFEFKKLDINMIKNFLKIA